MAKSNKYLLIIGILIYIIVGVFAINLITNWMTQEYYIMLGTKALDIAKIASNKFEITDREVEELKKLTFEETLEHPANKRLTALFTQPDFSPDFKYAYLMVQLKPEEVKYYVTKENEEFYEAKAGTPLNLLWLLDVIVNKEQQVVVSGTANYYDDTNRYSFLRGADSPYFKEEKSGYVIVKDEYGDSFTGMVPIYSKENNFVGLMGVDIYYESYILHTNNIRSALMLTFILPSIVLTIIYILLYRKKSSISDKEVNTDPLTQLYNRRYLEIIFPKVIRECCTKKQPLCAIMADIDYFKNYNDNYGHKMGDDVITSVCASIKSVLRSNMDVVCRYGGEEILILLPDTDLNGGINVAKKIKVAVDILKIPHDFSLADKFISISQGIYCAIPTDITKKAETDFIIKADKAMYSAKQKGRNRYEIYDANTMP